MLTKVVPLSKHFKALIAQNCQIVWKVHGENEGVVTPAQAAAGQPEIDDNGTGRKGRSQRKKRKIGDRKTSKAIASADTTKIDYFTLWKSKAKEHFKVRKLWQRWMELQTKPLLLSKISFEQVRIYEEKVRYAVIIN